MRSPLGLLFSNIFMSELENTIISTLGNKALHWKHVDETFAFIKPDQIQHCTFHKKAKFTYNYEQSNTISFPSSRQQHSSDKCFPTNEHTLMCTSIRINIISSTETALGQTKALINTDQPAL